MQRVVLVICVVTARLSIAQELSSLRKSEMLDCTFHQKSQSVDQKLYRSTVGFTYLLEAAKNRKPNTLYVAFWNPKMTEGKLLVFHLSKNPDHKDAFALVNDGWIHDKRGKLDVEDLLGGDLYI